MKVRPLWLRERLAYRIYVKHASDSPSLFVEAPLEFAPGVVLDLLPGDWAHGAIAFAGFYELTLTRRIAALARLGGTLIDVGANYGYYTCLWAAANQNNRVLALEPSPRNVGPLADNVRKNRFEGRVVVLEAAAGRREGTTFFTMGPAEQSGWGGLEPDGGAASTLVQCVRLDRVVADLGWDMVTVLKVDVEGADTWVLYGAEHLLKARRIQHVFFEHNPTRMANLGIAPTEAALWLKDLGYRLERLTASEWYAAPSGRLTVVG